MSPLKFPVFTPLSPVSRMVCYFDFCFFSVLYFAFVSTFRPFLSSFLCLAPLVFVLVQLLLYIARLSFPPILPPMYGLRLGPQF